MIYLDNNATASVDPRVREACFPYLTERFGNPSSGHVKGHEAKSAIVKAKQQVANSIGASVDEIVFTSGGSESNNFVLKGLFFDPNHFCKGHLIVSAFEHAAILKPAIPGQGWCRFDHRRVNPRDGSTPMWWQMPFVQTLDWSQ